MIVLKLFNLGNDNTIKNVLNAKSAGLSVEALFEPCRSRARELLLGLT